MVATLAMGLIAGVVVGVMQPTSQALANCDSGEQSIFWGNWSQAGAWQDQAYGSDNNLEVVNRTISQQCIGMNTSSTSFLNVNGTGTYNEIGWEEDWGSLGRYCQWFGEWYVNGVLKGRPVGVYPCTLNFGAYDRWRVKNVSGTTKFELNVDCQDGQGFKTMATTDPMITDNQGVPEGETSRIDGSATGMSDDHRVLEWLQSNGVWHDWNLPSARWIPPGTTRDTKTVRPSTMCLQGA